MHSPAVLYKGMQKPRNYREEIQAVKRQYMLGAITYAQAIHQCRPILKELNAKKKEIDEAAGMRFKPLTFAYVFR